MKNRVQTFCHCGLKDSWKKNRLCHIHIAQLRTQVETRVNYIEFKGQQVPVSPDGIPIIKFPRTFAELTKTLLNTDEIKNSKPTPRT